MQKLKKIPKFKSLSAEREFWRAQDSADYIDWSKAKNAYFPSLKPSTKTISLRLPESLLNDIKILANKEDVPYQSLMKILLTQGIKHENEHRKDT
ncbi:MAG TPA: BrnA antitoxin family protein [Gammaproteobacteria bacterium]|nr:BrnA antitoxin family protein [Gammaproteobacteria bacterium]